jgi:hypothetical protein
METQYDNLNKIKKTGPSPTKTKQRTPTLQKKEKHQRPQFYRRGKKFDRKTPRSELKH